MILWYLKKSAKLVSRLLCTYWSRKASLRTLKAQFSCIVSGLGGAKLKIKSDSGATGSPPFSKRSFCVTAHSGKYSLETISMPS